MIILRTLLLVVEYDDLTELVVRVLPALCRWLHAWVLLALDRCPSDDVILALDCCPWVLPALCFCSSDEVLASCRCSICTRTKFVNWLLLEKKRAHILFLIKTLSTPSRANSEVGLGSSTRSEQIFRPLRVNRG